MDELHESTKRVIKAEELYRFQVKQELEKNFAKKNDPSLFTVLNSAFTLWLLSAVFITGAGSIYTHWRMSQDQAQREQVRRQSEAAEKRQRIGRLRLEVGNRFSQALRLLADAERHKQHSRTTITEIVQELKSGKSFYSLYPEFSNQNTLTVLTELRELDLENA